jgi:hypothetical protein
VLGRAPHHVALVVGSTLLQRMHPELAATSTRRSSSASADSVSWRSVHAPCGASAPAAVSTVPWNGPPESGVRRPLSRLAEASPTSDVHSSRLGRRSLLASQLPTLSPHSASTPEGASARLGRGHALSDTPHRRGHLPSRSPGGSRGSSAQTPVIVSISHCALASSSRSPLSRRLLSYDPVVRFRGACGASGSGLRPSTMLALVEVNSAEGHGKLDHIASRRPGRTARAALVSGIRSPWERRTVVIPVVIDRCQQPTILFSRPATLRPGTLHSVFPHLAVARASRRPSQPRRSRLQVTGALSSPAAFPRVPRMLRHPRDPRQNATCRVHQRRPRPSRAKARSSSGQPPDGLDLRHRVA